MVRIEVQGDPEKLQAFVTILRESHPPQARVNSMQITPLPCQEVIDGQFSIRVSPEGGNPRPTIPADVATCAACLEEIRTPGERRYGYPFTNCTNCGPRWSILRSLPYDRPRTAMAGFPMCPECEAEYHDPADRRFHAQPIACPSCGPAIELLDATGQRLAEGDNSLRRAADALLNGRVLAMKGLGGFQLLVDATNSTAVSLLRRRKQRPDKPFALMFGSLEEVRAACDVSEEESRTLTSPGAPIVLLERLGRDAGQLADRPESSDKTATGSRRSSEEGREAGCARAAVPVLSSVAQEVAPGNPYLGVMLPYTPLHHLLTALVQRPLVCTSGNLSEEPMAITTEDALARLARIADFFLVHDRPIVRPVDDSVARVGPAGIAILRRARGFAPLPIDLSSAEEISASSDVGRIGNPSSHQANLPDGLPIRPTGKPTPLLSMIPRTSGEIPAVLAVGGHLKNTVALKLGSQVVLTPHIGDLDNVLSLEVHQRAIADLVEFFQVTPRAVACDLHPDYASTRHAETLATDWKVPLVRVQHHHAHVAACMAEHRLAGPVLGIAWDGAGYGPDGTIWGGEFIECREGEFRRIAHLRTFPLPGGDRAARQPRRSALGMLFEVFGEEAGAWAASYLDDGFQTGVKPMHPEADGSSGPPLRPTNEALVRLLASPHPFPRTSSMGRLFDGVAALCGFSSVSSFEGQAAMALEFSAEIACGEAYPIDLPAAAPGIADWEPMLRAILADRAAGIPIGRVSARFHNALAELAAGVARQWGGRCVALTGGCFQNALLARRVWDKLREAGFQVYLPSQVPPGDGGIALGQALIAAKWLSEQEQ
jgi:hydrogenase maturation protein HypF